LLFIDLSGIVICNAFSVVPSVFNENAKNVLFRCRLLLWEFFGGNIIFLPQKQNFPAALAARCRPAGGVIKLFFFTLDTFIK
jgi:hypothetical protein